MKIINMYYSETERISNSLLNIVFLLNNYTTTISNLFSWMYGDAIFSPITKDGIFQTYRLKAIICKKNDIGCYWKFN